MTAPSSKPPGRGVGDLASGGSEHTAVTPSRKHIDRAGSQTDSPRKARSSAAQRGDTRVAQRLRTRIVEGGVRLEGCEFRHIFPTLDAEIDALGELQKADR